MKLTTSQRAGFRASDLPFIGGPAIPLGSLGADAGTCARTPWEPALAAVGGGLSRWHGHPCRGQDKDSVPAGWPLNKHSLWSWGPVSSPEQDEREHVSRTAQSTLGCRSEERGCQATRHAEHQVSHQCTPNSVLLWKPSLEEVELNPHPPSLPVPTPPQRELDLVTCPPA